MSFLSEFTYDDKVTYSLGTPLEATAPIVLRAKQKILGSLDFDDLLVNLNIAADLIYLAYNAVAGQGEIRKEMVKIHDNFGRICGNCELQLTPMIKLCGMVPSKLKEAFELLEKGQIEESVKRLQSISATAKKLTVITASLAKEFDRLSTDVMNSAINVERTQGKMVQQKEDIMKNILDVKLKKAKALTLAESLRAQRAGVERQITDVLEEIDRKEKQKKKSFWAKLFSTIAMVVVSPIGFGIGYGLSKLFPGKSGGNGQEAGSLADSLSAAMEHKRKLEKELLEVQEEAKIGTQKKKEANTKIEEATGKLEERRQALKTIKEALEKLEKDYPGIESGNQGGDPQKDYLRLKFERETAELSVKTEGQRLASFQSDFDKASNEEKAAESRVGEKKKEIDDWTSTYNKLMELNAKTEKKIEDLKNEQQNYQKVVLQIRQEEAKNHDEIIRHTAIIGAAEGDVLDVEKVYNCLFLAGGALKQVVMTLEQTSYLWRQLETSFQENSDLPLIKKLETLKERALKLPSFKPQVLLAFADWKALEIVLKEYAERSKGIERAVQRDFMDHLSIEEAQKRVPILSKQVYEKELSLRALAQEKIKAAQEELDKSTLELQELAQEKMKSAQKMLDKSRL